MCSMTQKKNATSYLCTPSKGPCPSKSKFLPAFHALKASDTTSIFAGFEERTAPLVSIKTTTLINIFNSSVNGNVFKVFVHQN